MLNTSRRLALMALATLTLVGSLSTARAIEPGKDGWYATGQSMRVKKVAFVKVKVYQITSYVKELPPAKNKQAMIDLAADKKLVWKMQRDVPAEKIRDSLKDSFALNKYTDAAKINAFLAAYSKEQKEDSLVTISYDAAKKATTITCDGSGTATIEGEDFMKGVWSIWFGTIDPPSISEELISKLP